MFESEAKVGVIEAVKFLSPLEFLGPVHLL